MLSERAFGTTKNNITRNLIRHCPHFTQESDRRSKTRIAIHQPVLNIDRY